MRAGICTESRSGLLLMAILTAGLRQRITQNVSFEAMTPYMSFGSIQREPRDPVQRPLAYALAKRRLAKTQAKLAATARSRL